MLTKREAILVALLVTAFWALIFILTSDSSATYEICESAKDAPRECARYHVVSFAFRETAAHLDIISALITAFATIFIARFTYTLKRSTDNLWDASNNQLALLGDEFSATHRPRMRVKHIWFTGDKFAWRVGGPLEVNLDMVNIGNTTARVRMVNYQSLILPTGQRLPQRPPYDEMPPNDGVRITRFTTISDLASGITLYRLLCDGIVDAQDARDILQGTKRLYLIGSIEYWDAAGLRQTAFCRRLTYSKYPPTELEEGKFEIEKDPDYEYED